MTTKSAPFPTATSGSPEYRAQVREFLQHLLKTLNTELELLEAQVREKSHYALEIQTELSALDAEDAGAFSYLEGPHDR